MCVVGMPGVEGVVLGLGVKGGCVFEGVNADAG